MTVCNRIKAFYIYFSFDALPTAAAAREQPTDGGSEEANASEVNKVR